jgi:hypothetical protein
MKLPTPTSGSFEKCPPGNHLATCYEVIDLGTQTIESKQYGTNTRHQIWIGWEIPNETMEDGRPFVIGRKYTFSMSDKSAFRKHLESWRGKPFSDADYETFLVENLIGAGCFLNVVHSTNGDKTYANIEAVAALPKGTKAAELINDRVFFSLDPDEFDQDVFNGLSEYFQGLIQQSPEWQALKGKKPMIERVTVPAEPSGHDDETPF